MHYNLSSKLVYAAFGATVGLFSVGVGSAQAASFTYDLTGSQQTLDSLSLTQDGIAVDISGSGRIRQHGNGLGIIGGNFGQIDGSEVLTFDFGSQAFQILGAVFSRVNADDSFSLAANGGASLVDEIPFSGGTKDQNNVVVDFGESLTGSVFAFSVPENGGSYALTSLTFADVPEPPVVDIPEPSLTLGIATVLGLGVMSRRNQGKKGTNA
ncbi:MAG: PEP-CTERM sorting domain-containing protein [Microcoleaceae cyanobacterium]